MLREKKTNISCSGKREHQHGHGRNHNLEPEPENEINKTPIESDARYAVKLDVQVRVEEGG
jgi:hypothetical protein